MEMDACGLLALSPFVIPPSRPCTSCSYVGTIFLSFNCVVLHFFKQFLHLYSVREQGKKNIYISLNHYHPACYAKSDSIYIQPKTRASLNKTSSLSHMYSVKLIILPVLEWPLPTAETNRTGGDHRGWYLGSLHYSSHEGHFLI